jgi:hypothetical protein
MVGNPSDGHQDPHGILQAARPVRSRHERRPAVTDPDKYKVIFENDRVRRLDTAPSPATGLPTPASGQRDVHAELVQAAPDPR